MGNATPRGGISQQDGRELHSRGSCSVSAAIAPIVLAFLYMQAQQGRGGLDTHWFCIRWCVAAFLLQETSRNQSGSRRGFAGTSYCPSPWIQKYKLEYKDGCKYRKWKVGGLQDRLLSFSFAMLHKQDQVSPIGAPQVCSSVCRAPQSR